MSFSYTKRDIRRILGDDGTGAFSMRGSVSEEETTVKWISVDKKLPKWGERVIVAHRRYDWSNARHKWTRLKRLGVTAATFWVEDENGPRFTDGDDVVTEPVAWMPFPAPPSDSK